MVDNLLEQAKKKIYEVMDEVTLQNVVGYTIDHDHLGVTTTKVSIRDMDTEIVVIWKKLS